MRAFIALELPGVFADEVAGVARTLSARCPGRFMSRDSYHLTLAFLGEINEAGARSAIGALDEACAGASAIELASDGLGTFGRPRDATLWLGIRETGELLGRAASVRAALDARGVSYDRKPFRPHVTIARRVRIERAALPALAFPDPAVARCVSLFKSTLTAEGARYKALYRVELG